MKKFLFTLIAGFFVLTSGNVSASMFGEENAPLYSILAQAIRQLNEMQQLVNQSQQNLELLKDINRGIQEAMTLLKIESEKLNPGALSEYRNLQGVMTEMEKLTGKTPNTTNSSFERLLDTSISESIHLHNQAFRYADALDPEANRIKDYAKNASPGGAQKVTAQGIGMMINVLNQILRVDSAILKVQSEQLALANKNQKEESRHYEVQYETLARSFKQLGTFKKISPGSN
jgi:ABC-type multidrug transport system fused ATPase/permease subunit